HVIRSGSSGAACGSRRYCRQVPDISGDADPSTGYLIYYNGSGKASGSPHGWQSIGGTSAASPTWAGLIALADAAPPCHGAPIGFANPNLYTVAARAYARDFHDVRSGNNDFTGTNGG